MKIFSLVGILLFLTAAITAQSQTYLAKNAVLSTGTIIETKNAGYTDPEGYINFDNSEGSYAEWKVFMAATDSQTIYMRFANGGSSARPMQLSINDSSVSEIAFPVTGDFTNWEVDSVKVSLSEGLNIIRFTSLIPDGGPNLDYIEITGEPGTPKYTLTISKSGGTVSVDPDLESYVEKTEVTLTAFPDQGYKFVKWSGDTLTTDNPVTLKMDSDKMITAVFYIDFDTTITSYDEIPYGFASVDAYGQNGTTGGAGAVDTVSFTDFDSFQAFLLSRKDEKHNKGYAPVVILVKDTLKGTGQLSAKGCYDMTIIGVGNNAVFAGAGLQIANSWNIIVRNIEFRNCAPDCITIATTSSNTTHHIWIDHCTLSDSPEIDPGGTDHGGTHDGLLDISHRSDYITISWNHFYNHNKTCLLGYSDNSSDEQGVLKTTYHHNWFDNTVQRHPRVRYAECHVYNNFYDGSLGGMTGYGIASTQEADVVVEANYFRDVSDPTHIGEGSSGPGDLVAINNITENSGPILVRGEAFDPSTYYTINPDDPAKIPVIVSKYAGSGTLDKDTVVTDVNSDSQENLPQQFELSQNYPNPFNPATVINYSVPADGYYSIKIFNILGQQVGSLLNREIKAGNHKITFDGSKLSSGIYIYTLSGKNVNISKKMALIK